MLCAVCSVLRYLCSVICALCSVLCAVCSLLCALCSVLCAVCSVLYALCCMLCAVCSILYSLCSFLYSPLSALYLCTSGIFVSMNYLYTYRHLCLCATCSTHDQLAVCPLREPTTHCAQNICVRLVVLWSRTLRPFPPHCLPGMCTMYFSTVYCS
jgi:hypothetical protein